LGGESKVRRRKQELIVNVKAALAWFENHGDLGPLSPQGKGEIMGVFKPMHAPFHLSAELLPPVPPKKDSAT
jgi:hypothetical protein